MRRFASGLILAAIAILTALAGPRAQVPDLQPVALEAQSAARALDAIPAVFAISQNFEVVDFDVDGLVESLVALEAHSPAQEQLSAAVSVYGFSGYSDWLQTLRTVFATYAYAHSDAAKPAVDAILDEVVDDASVSQAQKDAILAEFQSPATDVGEPAAAEPSRESLRVVIGLSPQVKSAIETMQAMQ